MANSDQQQQRPTQSGSQPASESQQSSSGAPADQRRRVSSPLTSGSGGQQQRLQLPLPRRPRSPRNTSDASDQDDMASDVVSDIEDNIENEEKLHEQRHKQKRHHHHHHRHGHYPHHHQHGHASHASHAHHRGQQHGGGHIKELIKPDPTVRAQARANLIQPPSGGHPRAHSPAAVAMATDRPRESGPASSSGGQGLASASGPTAGAATLRVATVVDEEQLHQRLVESKSRSRGRHSSQPPPNTATTSSDRGKIIGPSTATSAAAPQRTLPNAGTSGLDGASAGVTSLSAPTQSPSPSLAPDSPASSSEVSFASTTTVSPAIETPVAASLSQLTTKQHEQSSPKSTSSSQSSQSTSKTSSHDDIDGMRSPPPTAIIIPPSVAKSLSAKTRQLEEQQQQQISRSSGSDRNSSARSSSSDKQPAAITREQFEYGPLLRSGEVQVLYRSPEAEPISSLDRLLKDEQAKQVAPNLRQSPIAIMSMNPTYELQDRPLIIEYPATVENLKLQNTGFSWQIKIPYQISMITNLYGAHLNAAHRYRLDQFHCHWGQNDEQGSEHTVDNRRYSAEMHFVHYNMEKYHTYSKAARHPDGLVVLSVFLDAQDKYHCHAELEKIVSHLKVVPLKGEHTIIRQAVRIENLLPANKSYWSYQGSLTTTPYFESVTWFILKRPIKCSTAQIQKFRSLKSALRHDEDGAYIRSNNRKTQPLNGRSIVNYDEHTQSSSSLTSLSSTASHAYR